MLFSLCISSYFFLKKEFFFVVLLLLRYWCTKLLSKIICVKPNVSRSHFIFYLIFLLPCFDIALHLFDAKSNRKCYYISLSKMELLRRRRRISPSLQIVNPMILFDLNGRGFLNLDEPRLTLIPFDDQIKVTSKVDLIKDCRWQQLFYKGQQHLDSWSEYF